MYAIIISGGKQHKVEEGQEVLLEKIEGKAGDKIEVGETIFLSKNGDKIFARDELEEVKIKGEIIEQTRDEKIIVFKYKPKKGYRRKRGHKRFLTKVLIEDINFPGKPAKIEKPLEPKEKVVSGSKVTKKKPKVKPKAKAKVKSQEKSEKPARSARKTKKSDSKTK